MFSYFKQAMQIFPHKLHCRYIHGRFFISFSYLKSAMTKDRNNFKDLHRYFKKWMNGRSECESLIISHTKRKARVFIDVYAVGWWICIESCLEWPNLLHRSSYLRIVRLINKSKSARVYWNPTEKSRKKGISYLYRFVRLFLCSTAAERNDVN